MLADLAIKWVDACVVCVRVGGREVGERRTESSFEKLQKTRSADVRPDVKQQEK